MWGIVTEMTGKFIRTGRVLNLYKKLGETPRERLERLRSQKTEYGGEVLSYAGRLDPMAEGVLLCLVGSANKMREAYLDMDKEYLLDVLFGFSTDTYDLLGKILQSGDPESITPSEIKKELNKFRGILSQQYPPFSSKSVEGKPLFTWARGSALGAMILPRRTITIYDASLEGAYKIKESTLLSYIESTVVKVQGDFRQEDMLYLWKKTLSQHGTRVFPCATIHIHSSSGTYARSIADSLGERLGIPALALRIIRTRVGEYTIEHSLH